MSKKIYDYSVYAIVVLSMLGIIFQMSGMERPEEKTIIEKNIEDGENKLKPNGEIYLYDVTTGQGSIFEAELIPMCIIFKNMFEDSQSNKSLALPAEYSNDTIKILHNLLQECYKFQETQEKTQEYIKNVNDLIVRKLGQIKDIAQLGSILGLANYLNVEKTIFNPIVNQVKQKVNAIIDGQGRFTDNDIAIFDLIDPSLLKIIMQDKWDIFIEKMKIALVKKYFGAEKEKYSYTIDKKSNGLVRDSGIANMSFSPDGKFLYMKSQWFEEDRQRMHIDGCLIVTIVNKQCKNLIKQQDNSIDIIKEPYFFNGPWIWIDKNKFSCIQSDNIALKLYLYFYDCELQKATIEKLSFPTYKQFDRLYIYDALSVGNEIIFFYAIVDNAGSKEYGIGTFNYENKEVDYQKLENIPKIWHPKIISQSKKSIKFMGSSAEKQVFYKFEFETKELIELKEFDAYTKLAFADSGKKIAASSGSGISLYFLDTGDAIQCSNEKGRAYPLEFSSDGKVFMVTQNNKIVFFSAITGENIGEFQSHEGLCFENNALAVFSSDGNKIAICDAFSERTDRSLLIMNLIPDQYYFTFNQLQNSKFSFSQLLLLISLQKRSNNGKNPVELTDQEKEIFGEFNYRFAKLLIDIKYVLPIQLSEVQEKQRIKAIKKSYISALREQENAEEYIRSKQAEISLIDELPDTDYKELVKIAEDIEKEKKSVEDLKKKKADEYKYKKLISKKFGTQREDDYDKLKYKKLISRRFEQPITAKILEQAKKSENLPEEAVQTQPIMQSKQRQGWSDVLWNAIKKRFLLFIGRSSQ